MPAKTQDVLYAYVPLTKAKTPEGHYIVRGIATDDSLDLDKQICDADWLATAMPEWFKNRANIREMHQPSAVGKANELTQKGTGWEIAAKIVDSDAIAKLDEGIYTGFSIGIKDYKLDKSEAALKRAPKGVIVGGYLPEISLVDVPANPNAKLDLAKRANGVLVKTDAVAEIDLDGCPPCTTCGGFGEVLDEGEMVTCPKCQGTGEGDIDLRPSEAGTGSDDHDDGLVGDKADKADCATCEGTGKIRDGHVKCPDCDGTGLAAEGKTDEPELTKAERSTKETNDLPDSAFAYIEPGGERDSDGKTVPRDKRHFPIDDAAHVRNALARAPQSPFGDKAMPKIRAAAKKFGIEVADKLGSFYDVLTKADEPKHDAAQLAQVRSDLISLITQELSEMDAGDEDETGDVYQLLSALCTFLNWWDDEADEGEVDEPFTNDDQGDILSTIFGLSLDADLVKRASTEDATDEDKESLAAAARKALGVDAQIATATSTVATLLEKVSGLEGELAKVKQMAAPRGIALRAQQQEVAKAARADGLRDLAAGLRARAATPGFDRATAEQYRAEADRYDEQAKSLNADNTI